MPVTDPIADFLTRIRNAQMAGRRWVDVPASNLKKRIALILKHERFIRDFIIIEDGKQGIIRLFLKYTKDGQPVIAGLKRISKPGRRIYVPADKVPRVLGGLGIAILSTSKGVITDKVARKENVGGEVLCYIW
ncbi:MAG: 30S ribosomal protein S8 [Candidatus Neomarinimicrobiota bacterium]|nr:30S ribosomal protein S8 [Candidatus Neomarinimicrobiota bacterium]RKY48022.1 MAG: 30S ribosomal protein S8 [Candidatus Neomarinimicrobiota bacterium]RKY48673.1 MAG: 30S ribosomal protein S8 [Candidatus Neomarinimicrobiota bacterium]RKY54551.1 MAG: 30S ribosomal protein S8 [Candidatus Neomarinimicrobiota bacterium]